MGKFLKHLFTATLPPRRTLDGTDTGNDTGIDTANDILRHVPSMLRPVAAAYRRRYAQYGAVPKGVYWSDSENARRRFVVLCRVFDPADIALGGASINDLGCGYGALYDFLKNHPVMRGGQYHGYDITRSLLEACEDRIKDPRAHFHYAMGATETADYSIVSGTFNMSIRVNEDRWLSYVLASLQSLWQRTNKAMAFNMLDNVEKSGPDDLYYADPAVFEDFCRSRLSDNVEVITGYGLPDFTIFVRR